MRHEDREDFDVALSAALSVYDKPPVDEDVFKIWMSVLEQFSLEQVRRALRAHVSTSRFAPKPVDIVEMIHKQDGHLSADEAWPQVIKAADENASLIWTEEMQQAWFHCKPIFDAGDEVGARMAFRQFYTRLLEDARLKGVPAKPFPTLGFDVDSRVEVIQRAKSMGLISHEQALRQLPSPEPDEGDEVLRIGNDMKLTVSKNAPLSFREKFNQILDEANARAAEKAKQEQQRKDEIKKAEEDRRELLMRQAGIMGGDDEKIRA